MEGYGDSLLEMAGEQLTAYNQLLAKNNKLEKELKSSNERLKTAKDETRKIKETLATKMDDETVKEFNKKVEQLSADGKINKNEKNDLMQIEKKLENTVRAYQVLQGENNYLRRVIEKQSARAELDNIPTTPEKSSDVEYLRKEVDRLRKEVALLRKMEDNYLRLKQQCDKKVGQSQLSEQDAENIRTIIEDRNNLREKVKAVKNMEKKMQEMQQKEKDLNENLNNKNGQINNMEGEMDKMQKYYDDQCKKSIAREEDLKVSGNKHKLNISYESSFEHNVICFNRIE